MKKSLIALAFGTLALGMSEFVMMGILPDIARSLGVSVPQAGHLISAYALGVCIGAPLMVFVARRRPLKWILLLLSALIVIGNLCAAAAPGYWVLLAMRFVSGLPHGAFFGAGSIVAEQVADRRQSLRRAVGYLYQRHHYLACRLRHRRLVGHRRFRPHPAVGSRFAAVARQRIERAVPVSAPRCSVGDSRFGHAGQRRDLLLV